MKNQHDILVLNRGYTPIHIVSWQIGMSLIYTGKCKPLDREFLPYTFSDWLAFSISNADTYHKIATSKYPVAVPEIIVSTSFDRLPDRKVKYSRANIFTRDHNTCGYCGNYFPTKDLTVDHIIPRDQGGKTEWTNIVSCCFRCNQTKANKTPHQAGMKLLHKPHQPKWISPLANVDIKMHPCKSWGHFMKRADIKGDSV